MLFKKKIDFFNVSSYEDLLEDVRAFEELRNL